MTNGRGKSDGFVVPEKSTNKGRGAPRFAESMEGRGPAKGNTVEGNRVRAQDRATLRTKLDRVREAVRRDPQARMTTLWHHVYDIDRLREAYLSLNRTGASGVDEVTWSEYGDELESNLADLSGRLQRGSYRAKAVRRVYIPKADGRQRPLGVPTLEDKVVQRATTEVLQAVYEEEFHGFSYGFRPGRSQHNALDAVVVGIERRKINWVLDADIRGFFDTIDHEWLIRFVEHRIGDKRVVRHIKKWLNAGVLEDGELRRAEEGTPQGGSISPLLANIYLHYALDDWVEHWRRQARGHVIIVRYADDFVMGFEHKEEAERLHRELIERLRRFNLELHPDKTRLIEFGRYADDDRRGPGGRPETFDFLGFTHYCGRTRKGGFAVKRRTRRKKLQEKLIELRQQLRRRMHRPIPETGKWLASVLVGHYQYFGVPHNIRAMKTFRAEVEKAWMRALRRRSHKHRLTWERMNRLANRWLPHPRILHPYPIQRLRV